MANFEPVTRIEKLLNEIAENTSGSGGSGAGLPAVTSEDNGDVLTVVNGAWDKAAPSGGGAFAVSVPYSAEVWTMNKTWAEISAAFIAGRPVIVHVGDSEDYTDQYYAVMGVRQTVSDVPLFVVVIYDGSSGYEFAATSADGYPEYVW